LLEGTEEEEEPPLEHVGAGHGARRPSERVGEETPPPLE